MTAKKYRTLVEGGVRPKGYEWRDFSGVWKKGECVGEKILRSDVFECRAPIVKRKKAGKKK